MSRAGISRLSHVIFAVVVAACILAVAAPPVAAQITSSFTKDDCNGFSNPACGDPNDNCDGIQPPVFPISGRSAVVGAQAGYHIEVVNDGTPETGLTLTDVLPPCASLLCGPTTVDTDCDGTADDGPVIITFSGGGSAGTIDCDSAANTLTISDISLGADETMLVQFGATMNAEGQCCNDAELTDGTDTESASDALNDPSNPDQVCVDVGPPFFWKDDCGPRTSVDGVNPDPADCDDVMLDGLGERAVTAPPDDKRVQWVINFTNTQGAPNDVSIQDTLPPDQNLICDPILDPLGQGWGCFDIYINNVLQTPDPALDTCVGGAGGFIDVGARTLQPDDELEVRICARLTDQAAGQTCNDDIVAQFTFMGFPTQRPPSDNLDGDRDICINVPTPPPGISATKTFTNLDGDPADPGDTIEYTIEICEETGNQDVTADFVDDIPANIINPVLDPNAPPQCLINGNQIDCSGLVLPAGDCANPITIVWQGEVDCTGLAGGDPICNQGQVTATNPPNPTPVFTDDPDDPTGDNDPTCFPIALDELNVTKSVALSDDVDGDTLADCQEDTLTYTIDVCNDAGASSDAVNVEMIDDIPAEVAHVPGSTLVDGNPGPDPAAGTLTVPVGTLAPGECSTITYDVTIGSVADGTVVSNTADATSDDSLACGVTITSNAADMTISCGAVQPPAFDDATKEVTDTDGNPITGASPGEEIVYNISWCNTGRGEAIDVWLMDNLPDCVTLVDAEPGTPEVDVLLDGNPIEAFDAACPNGGLDPTADVCFLADDVQDPDSAECHTAEIHVQVVTDPVNCPVDDPVENVGTIATGDGAVSGDTDGGTPTIFRITAGTAFSLRRDSDLVTRDPTDPAKMADRWGTDPPDSGGAHIMELVGACDPAAPRIESSDEIDTPIAVPFTFCDPDRGVNSFGTGTPIEFWEVNDCDFTLLLRRTDCDASGGVDIEVDYQP